MLNRSVVLVFSPLPSGFVVGQCGLYQAIAMFLVAYFIISMTVLSVCAISTNGALDAGGAYCILLSNTHTAVHDRCIDMSFQAHLLYTHTPPYSALSVSLM